MPLKPTPEGLQPLQAVRRAKRMTQTELGRLVEMDQQTISRLETGFSNPTREQLARLCHALRVKPELLFAPTILAELERRVKAEQAAKV